MAKEYEYLDDYTVGDTFISPARTITEADIVNFAGITGDWHPMHTDVEYAAKTPFRERIAHGMLILSIGLVLPRLGPHSSFSAQILYGLLWHGQCPLYGTDENRRYHPLRSGGDRNNRQGKRPWGLDNAKPNQKPEG